MSRREKIHLRVTKGGLQPADKYAESRLREKNYRVGDVVGAQITKLRSPGTNKNAHAIGNLMVHQHEFFNNMQAHTALKYLQIESGVACDIFGSGDKIIKVPRSLSFESMDEGDFYEAVKGICRHISENYWQGITPEQIQMQAERFINE
jgi:hypothetical protein